MKDKLRRKRRLHYFKVFLLLFTVYLAVAGAYSYITLNHTHDNLLRESEDNSRYVSYETMRNDEEELKKTVDTATYDAEIEVYRNDALLMKKSNKINVDFGEKVIGYPGIAELGFSEFRSSMTDEQYENICSYLSSTPVESRLSGELRYELLCRAYYRSGGIIYPKTVEIVVTNGQGKRYTDVEPVKTYSLMPDTSGLESKALYESGDDYRNPIDTDFVFGKYRLKGWLKDFEKYKKGQKESSFEVHTSLFSYVYYSEEKQTFEYSSFGEGDNRADIYLTRYARGYNLLDGCLVRIIIGCAVAFVFFLIVGFLLAHLSWRSIRTELEQEIIRRDMTRAMAHDLKTPMFIISGYAENLKEDINAEKRNHYLDVIVEQTDRMNRIVHSMLDYSRFELPDFELACESFTLEEMVGTIVEEYPEERLEFNGMGKTGIRADRNLLTTVIDNFIDNALKYSDGGKVSVKVENKRFSVTNRVGSSISEEQLKAVWKPYTKLDSSRVSGGNGLGLAISKRILELHKFRFGADSGENSVTFWFEF